MSFIYFITLGLWPAGGVWSPWPARWCCWNIPRRSRSWQLRCWSESPAWSRRGTATLHSVWQTKRFPSALTLEMIRPNAMMWNFTHRMYVITPMLLQAGRDEKRENGRLVNISRWGEENKTKTTEKDSSPHVCLQAERLVVDYFWCCKTHERMKALIQTRCDLKLNIFHLRGLNSECSCEALPTNSGVPKMFLNSFPALIWWAIPKSISLILGLGTFLSSSIIFSGWKIKKRKGFLPLKVTFLGRIGL